VTVGVGEGDAPEPAAEAPAGLRGERDRGHLLGAIEAVLFLQEAPLPARTLAAGLGVPEAVVLAALAELADGLARHRRGVRLYEVAHGWRLYSAEEYAEDVERFVRDAQSARLSPAALETLAIVAYQQPVTRARISAIRGVAVDGVVRSMLARGLLEEQGNDAASGAVLYVTTPLFLEKLGLASLDDLPLLAPLLPDVETMMPELSNRESSM